jgi:CheY-like chemotaxis protein
MNSILYFIHWNTPEYFDVLEQNNKWSKLPENSVKVTNYLNTQKHPDAIICDYNLPEIMVYFDWIRKQRI